MNIIICDDQTFKDFCIIFSNLNQFYFLNKEEEPCESRGLRLPPIKTMPKFSL